MLSLAKIGFWVLIAILGLRLVLRLTRKLEGPLTSDLLLLIGAVAIYGLIQVPAIEGFLATDRLLLLDGVIIACSGTGCLASMEDRKQQDHKAG